MASAGSHGGASAIARPAPIQDGTVRRFTRGREQPRGVVWFGARSFWGHLRHLLSAAIASENIDSRDWMTPDDPETLRSRIGGILGGSAVGSTLTESLGRDLYIDFVADTGDDVAISRAVATLLFAPYELPDPDRPGETLIAPRGDILLFGGDTAYPVATAQEILNRVIVPWNQVLRSLPGDDRPRVLLGIPGNHDWYDGLDGFSRMFRRRPRDPEVHGPVVGVSHGIAGDVAAWAREFVRGGAVEKPRDLVLEGYTPVQSASHFALRLAPHIELLAADRQLTVLDPRQRQFLGDHYRAHPDSATLLVMPDPVFAFGVPAKPGVQVVEKLNLDLEGRETFVLTGDLHHYERLQGGKALHVIAGGGGAFVHPARIAGGGVTPKIVWPSAAQSRALLRGVPWKLALGRSGRLPHICLLALFAPAILLDGRSLGPLHVGVAAPIIMTAVLGTVFALIGGAARRLAVLPLALFAAAVIAALPIAGSTLVRLAFLRLGHAPSSVALSWLTLLVATFAGAFVFGAFLSLLTLLGYENLQALAALDHPGFKHFVRLRVRADGSGIDGWCIGATDPLGAGQKAELVDHFVWRPRRAR
jgi:hypothetical protein